MYGYQLTLEINKILETKESTIYGILNKIKSHGWCTTYSQESKDGTPSRRYYRINKLGQEELNKFKIEWTDFSKKVLTFFEIKNGENSDESIS